MSRRGSNKYYAVIGRIEYDDEDTVIYVNFVLSSELPIQVEQDSSYWG